MGEQVNLSSKLLKQLNLDEVIYAHLTRSYHTNTRDHLLRSCLHEVEEEMRQSRGLQVTSRYAPVMCAFALLDQIGSTYSDLSKQPYPDKNASGIKKALYYWAGYSANDPETKALYAFRNGIDHDGSLTSEAKSGEWYIFRYRQNLGSPVELSQTPWDGTAATLGSETTTLIDVRELTELVCAAVQSVRNCFAGRRNDLKSHQSKESILHKYIFWSAK